MDKIQEFKNHYKKEILPYIPSLNKKENVSICF